MTVGHIWPPLFYSLACSLLPTFGTSQHVVLMLRFCTDTRDADKAEQFFHEPCLIFLNVLFYFHDIKFDLWIKIVLLWEMGK